MAKYSQRFHDLLSSSQAKCPSPQEHRYIRWVYKNGELIYKKHLKLQSDYDLKNI